MRCQGSEEYFSERKPILQIHLQTCKSLELLKSRRHYGQQVFKLRQREPTIQIAKDEIRPNDD